MKTGGGVLAQKKKAESTYTNATGSLRSQQLFEHT